MYCLFGVTELIFDKYEKLVRIFYNVILFWYIECI